MFINTQMMGLKFGFPDVCKTPAPTGTLPIPYPNIALPTTANPATSCLKVLTVFMPTHNLTTLGTISNGDNAGVMGGVASSTVMGSDFALTPSFTLLVGGMPTQRLTTMGGQNGFSLNAPGASIVPSQPKVLCLKA